MEEQSPTDPQRGRREKAKPVLARGGREQPTPRSRHPEATFTPPQAPRNPDQRESPASRTRAVKAPPAVLFQPPAAEQGAPKSTDPSAPDNDELVAKDPPPAAAEPPAEVSRARKATPPAAPGRNPAEPTVAQAGPAKATSTKATPTKQSAGGRKASAAKKPSTRSRAAAREEHLPPSPVEPPPAAEPAPARRAAGKTAPRKTASRKAKQATERNEPAAAPAQRESSPPVSAVPDNGPLVAVAAAAEARPAQVAQVARLLDHPGYAPELLALAAVAALGPPAQVWARRTQESYPAATPDGLARMATRRFVRLAGASGAASAAAGLFGPLAELAAIAWTRAGLVLHLAAAYEQDPTHPDRAADLLVLTQVHPDDEAAQAALRAAREVPPDAGDLPLHRLAEAGWRLAAPLAAQTGGWLALCFAARLLPGAALLAAAAGNSASAQRLAARAVARYRGPGAANSSRTGRLTTS
jgi:hypothetical protein